MLQNLQSGRQAEEPEQPQHPERGQDLNWFGIGSVFADVMIDKVRYVGADRDDVDPVAERREELDSSRVVDCYP